MTAIDEFLAKVAPLDLLVFKGSDLVSDTISGLESYMIGTGAVTHVGVAMTRDLMPFVDDFDTSNNDGSGDKELLIWESILSGPLSDGVYNEENGKTTFGVQFRNLREVVSANIDKSKTSDTVGVCKLKDNPTVRKSGESKHHYAARIGRLKRKLKRVYKRYNGTQFNFNFLDLLATVFPKLRPIRDIEEKTVGAVLGTDKWLFCSEFATTLYQYIGVVDPKVNFRDATPADYLPDADDEASSRERASPIHDVLSAVVEAPIWVEI